jgi:hypothetical protein
MPRLVDVTRKWGLNGSVVDCCIDFSMLHGAWQVSRLVIFPEKDVTCTHCLPEVLDSLPSGV